MPASNQGVAVSGHRYQLIPRVLCFVFAGDDVLLLKGAPEKKIWPGRFNGLGGHVERGETIQAAAEREIREEAGLSVTDLRLRGVVNIDPGQTVGIGLYVFSATTDQRGARASSEGTLEWVPVARIHEWDCVEDVPVLVSRVAAADRAAPPFSAHYAYDGAGQLVMTFAKIDDPY